MNASPGDNPTIVVQPEDIELVVTIVVRKDNSVIMDWPRSRPLDTIQVIGTALQHVAAVAAQNTHAAPALAIPTAETRKLLGVN